MTPTADGRGGDIPFLVWAEDHRDDEAREQRAARECPPFLEDSQNRRVDDHRGDDRGDHSGSNERGMSGASDDEQYRQNDEREPFRRAEEAAERHESVE